MSYQSDRAWSDSYLPAVKSIVGPRLLVPAPLERDRCQATDLIVLRARDMTIAVRLRREGFADRFPRQFTIRSERHNGTKTELAKIVDGWGDWLFYGHASGPENVYPWLLIDLHGLRAAFIRKPSLLHCPDKISSGQIENIDGATSFFWFDISRLPGGVVIGESTPRKQELAA